MLDIMNVIATLVTGAAGWAGTHYLASPILSLRQLRYAIHEELFYTKNIGWINANGTINPSEKEQHDKAVIEIRRLAAKISATEATWPRYLNLYLRHRHFDLSKATMGLTGLSNGLADPAIHVQFVTQVEEALSLPRSYPDKMLSDLKAAQQRRLEKSYEQGNPQ